MRMLVKRIIKFMNNIFKNLSKGILFRFKLINLSLKFRIFLVFISIFLILIIALGVSSIKVVNIKGNSWYSDEEINEKIFPTKFSKNSLFTFINSKFLLKKKAIPFIEDYSIIFKSPFSVELIIYEKSIIASVEYMSSYMYFDKDGIVVESSTKKLEKIPVLKRINVGDIVLYKKLPINDELIFSDILNLTQMLSVKEIYADYIEYNSSDDISIIIGDIKVELGKMSEINEKILILSDILPKLEGLSGYLYLNVSKESNSGTYTFKKK